MIFILLRVSPSEFVFLFRVFFFFLFLFLVEKKKKDTVSSFHGIFSMSEGISVGYCQSACRTDRVVWGRGEVIGAEMVSEGHTQNVEY